MGSDALAPAFVHNVFNTLEIGGVQRQKVAARKIDDFGEVRQFYVLVFGQQTLDQGAQTAPRSDATFAPVQAANRSYLDRRGWRSLYSQRRPLPAIPTASECLEIARSSEHRP